jgi:hypothetical protein
VHTAITAAAMGGLISIVGIAAMLAIWHDPATLQAWRSSGGLEEAFVGVPVILIAIGTVVGFAGALLGKLAANLFAKP